MSNKPPAEHETEEKDTTGDQSSCFNLTRRESLALGAGAGAGLAGLSTLSTTTAEAASTDGLEVFEQGDPRVVPMRWPESYSIQNRPDYDEFETFFSVYDGINAKALNEVFRGGREQVVQPLMQQYKKENPEKLVLNHFLGYARRIGYNFRGQGPDSGEAYKSGDFFDGHWLYYAGTTLTEAAESDEKELQVDDASIFTTNRVAGQSDDIGVALVGADGQPDWERAEQVYLESIDEATNTITVKRGMYETDPMSLPEGTYLAPHGRTVPFGGVDLWLYNLSTACPRDANGRNCIDALAEDLASEFDPDGPLSSFDGIAFDILQFRAIGWDPERTPENLDVNTDGEADAGIIDGINTFGVGSAKFGEKLRNLLPDKIITSDGNHIEVPGWEDQRNFGSFNGLESEGWPAGEDYKIDTWSSGLNRHNFWQQNSASPNYSYTMFKYRNVPEDERANQFLPPGKAEMYDSYRKLRLVLAGTLFTDSVFSYPGVLGYRPPSTYWREGEGDVAVFDELWQGVEQNLNWLGMPEGPAVHLASRSEDLLRGQGVAWTEKFIDRFEGDGAGFRRVTGGGQSPRMVVESTSPPESNRPLQQELSFTLPDVEVPNDDLYMELTLKGEPIEGYPDNIGRQVYVSAKPEGSAEIELFTWANQDSFKATFYYRDVGSGPVDLTFRVEGDEPVTFERMRAYSAADAMYREYENGAVFANPSNRSYTFDMAELFEDASFRRIQGVEDQDPETNNGQPVGDELTIPARDALLVRRVEK